MPTGRRSGGFALVSKSHGTPQSGAALASVELYH